MFLIKGFKRFDEKSRKVSSQSLQSDKDKEGGERMGRSLSHHRAGTEEEHMEDNQSVHSDEEVEAGLGDHGDQQDDSMLCVNMPWIKVGTVFMPPL